MAQNDKPAEPARTSWWPVLGVGILALIAARKPVPAGAARPSNGRTARDEAAGGQRPEAVGRDRTDPARGRQAQAPQQIPAKGWKDILLRVWQDVGDHRVLAVAAGVTFYALLALFPAIAAFVSLYGLFANPSTIDQQIGSLSGILPSGALDILTEEVKRIASKPAGTLSFALITSLAISLWSANAGVKAMFDALNVVYDEKEKRGFISLNLRSLAFTLGAIAVLIIAIVSVVIIPVVLKFVGLGGVTETILKLARWPVMLIAVWLGLSVLYRYGPSRDEAQWRWIFWGAGIAAVLWLGGSALFSWYVASFGNYNATYGSLGAAIGFMTWIWISSIVVLMGAEIDAEMEHQTTKDTTVGPPKPLGQRGATMADTVGEAKG